jgi:hypothetical protein
MEERVLGGQAEERFLRFARTQDQVVAEDFRQNGVGALRGDLEIGEASSARNSTMGRSPPTDERREKAFPPAVSPFTMNAFSAAPAASGTSEVKRTAGPPPPEGAMRAAWWSFPARR